MKVLAVGSLEARLKELAAENGLLVWAAVVCTGILATANGLMLIFLDVPTVWYVSDTMVAFNATSTVRGRALEASKG